MWAYPFKESALIVEKAACPCYICDSEDPLGLGLVVIYIRFWQEIYAGHTLASEA
jgi:hypothetical protein